MRKLLLAPLLLPLSVTAQRLELGLSSGGRVSFTDWKPSISIYDASKSGLSAVAGLEASYTFRSQRVRISTGVLRGELVQAVRLKSPAFPVRNQPVLELRSVAWQVPLRLHTEVWRLGQKAAASVRTGLVWQLNAKAARLGGNFKNVPYADPGSRRPVYWTDEPTTLYYVYPVDARRTSNLLLETGAELSYALTQSISLDAAVVYQAGLRQIQAFSLFQPNSSASLIDASSKGSNMLLALSARYVLKAW